MASFRERIEMRIKKHGFLSIEELEPRMTPSGFRISCAAIAAIAATA